MEELGKRDRLSEKEYLVQTFEKVLEWFEKLGLRTDVGRVAAYKEYFKYLDAPPKDEIIPPIRRANVSRELFELIWIYESFVNYDSPKIKNHVKATLKGVIASNLDETNNHSSRNYLFELRAASYFIKAGYEIDLSTECDLIATKGNYKYYVECKRMSSKDKISHRIKEAAKQLNKRLTPNLNKYSFGIIWIDLSFIQMNYTGFYSTYYRRTCQIAARFDLAHLVQENIPIMNYNKKIIGLMGQTLYPAITEVPKGIFTGSTLSLMPLSKNIFKKKQFKKITKELLKDFG